MKIAIIIIGVFAVLFLLLWSLCKTAARQDEVEKEYWKKEESSELHSDCTNNQSEVSGRPKGD